MRPEVNEGRCHLFLSGTLSFGRVSSGEEVPDLTGEGHNTCDQHLGRRDVSVMMSRQERSQVSSATFPPKDGPIRRRRNTGVRRDRKACTLPATPCRAGRSCEASSRRAQRSSAAPASDTSNKASWLLRGPG